LKASELQSYNGQSVKEIMSSLHKILPHVTKPARYTGGEWNSTVKDWATTPIKVALAFPDTYEIGMSNMAIPILYKLFNSQKDILAERVYAPWVDMEAEMRQHDIPLFSLESKHPLGEFDIIGFSLGYELTYTNMLNMLDLAKIPAFSKQRNASHPLIIAGGSCALNPEPVADFIDLFVVGDAEELVLKLMETYRIHRQDRAVFLRHAEELPGIYVPALYHVEYHEDGTLASFIPNAPEAKKIITRQMVPILQHPVTSPVVPYIEVIHDRGAIEIQRGCSRGCRFCQAGMIYRPVRELTHEEVISSSGELVENCGYNEISLVSLSTGDFHDIHGLVRRLSQKYNDTVSLSLPSLRLDKSSIALIEALPHKRKVTLTFAPEAGTDRLRKAINKVVSEELVLDTFAAAFAKGWMNLKLYFMIGLPTETMDDVKGIVDLVTKISITCKNIRHKPPRIRVSASTFVPKPHTACQWLPQDTEAQLSPKLELLKQGLRWAGAQLSWQEPNISLLEAALSRGDRRLSKVIYRAWQSGCRFDTWNEHFKYQNWLDAFAENGLDPTFYAHRERALSELLPWQHIDIGVSRSFLEKEYNNIKSETETPDCRHGACNACGLQRWHPDCLAKLKSQSEKP
jgi:radical SAM family uncharacterized protein